MLDALDFSGLRRQLLHTAQHGKAGERDALEKCAIFCLRSGRSRMVYHC